jgi:hypothetical protein
MKTQIAIFLVALLVLLLVSSAALAKSSEPVSTTLYSVQHATLAGGSFRLTSLCWEVSGIASGGGMRLIRADAPSLTGNGCCCAYLPLILK